MEWRFFEEGETPVFTTEEFFGAHPWIDPAHQIGHAERIEMVVSAFDELMLDHPRIRSITDLGCGDGSFLRRVHGRANVKAWGFDAGRANVQIAQEHGVNVKRANILEAGLNLGEVVVLTEVLEHLVDPHGLLRSLGGKWLIVTSPSGETDQWHYEHHAWAWDTHGFQSMIADAGWTIRETYETIARKTVAFPPSNREWHPRFQCVVAERA